jgi:hypothetical protein
MIKNIEELIIYTNDTGTQSIFLRSDRNGFVDANSQSNLQRWMRWREILSAAENNQSLENAIQQIEVIYELTRKRNS